MNDDELRQENPAPDDEPMRPTAEDVAAMEACCCLPHPFDPTTMRRARGCPTHPAAPDETRREALARAMEPTLFGRPDAKVGPGTRSARDAARRRADAALAWFATLPAAAPDERAVWLSHRLMGLVNDVLRGGQSNQYRARVAIEAVDVLQEAARALASHPVPVVSGVIVSVRDLAGSPSAEEPDCTEVTVQFDPPRGGFREGQWVTVADEGRARA